MEYIEEVPFSKALCNGIRNFYIEKTGHTYQQKEQEVADTLLTLVQEWRN